MKKLKLAAKFMAASKSSELQDILYCVRFLNRNLCNFRAFVNPRKNIQSLVFVENWTADTLGWFHEMKELGEGVRIPVPQCCWKETRFDLSLSDEQDLQRLHHWITCVSKEMVTELKDRDYKEQHEQPGFNERAWQQAWFELTGCDDPDAEDVYEDDDSESLEEYALEHVIPIDIFADDVESDDFGVAAVLEELMA